MSRPGLSRPAGRSIRVSRALARPGCRAISLHAMAGQRDRTSRWPGHAISWSTLRLTRGEARRTASRTSGWSASRCAPERRPGLAACRSDPAPTPPPHGRRVLPRDRRAGQARAPTASGTRRRAQHQGRVAHQARHAWLAPGPSASGELASSTASRSSHSIRSGSVHSGRASNSVSRPGGALRFHGHTSWQMSQPKTQP